MKNVHATTESWVTAIVAVLTSINQLLALTGHNPFSDISSDSMYNIVSAIVTIVVMAVSYWRDHPWTEEACEGTGLTRLLKAQKKGAIYEEPDVDDPEDEEVKEESANEDL